MQGLSHCWLADSALFYVHARFPVIARAASATELVLGQDPGAPTFLALPLAEQARSTSGAIAEGACLRANLYKMHTPYRFVDIVTH